MHAPPRSTKASDLKRKMNEDAGCLGAPESSPRERAEMGDSGRCCSSGVHVCSSSVRLPRVCRATQRVRPPQSTRSVQSIDFRCPWPGLAGLASSAGSSHQPSPTTRRSPPAPFARLCRACTFPCLPKSPRQRLLLACRACSAGPLRPPGIVGSSSPPLIG